MNEDTSNPSATLESIYPICRSLLSDLQWNALANAYAKSPEDTNPASSQIWAEMPELLSDRILAPDLPAFLADLALVERARFEVAIDPTEIPRDVDALTLNPTLIGLELKWKLGAYLACPDPGRHTPEEGDELLLVWRVPESSETHIVAASEKELLGMKLALEGITIEEAARIGQTPSINIKRLVRDVTRQGIVLSPPSHMQRRGEPFSGNRAIPKRFLFSDSFTLQWHLTNACELHCKHCYDRTQPSPLIIEQAKQILYDFVAFCRSRRVQGHVCLTGGNPFLFRHFWDLYRIISETDLEISILGNPISREQLKRLTAIREPTFFQVSLEGLQYHNDQIRGHGHFQRVMEFLSLSREAGIYSTVMLTLTKANIDQVLPLTEHLRHRVDKFNFNRLSEVGEGANLESASAEQYAAFLKRYLTAAESNPILAFKDNLFNILQHRAEQPLFAGCTGHGCGAAFNFFAVLPNGEAHACRKFSSPIGNILEEGIGAVYDSDAAERYRQGSWSCRTCPIRPACGGCLAVTAGQGLDPLKHIDPHCFMQKQE